MRNHDRWIELESFSWDVNNQANFAKGQGGQATQSKIHGISVTKICDKSSVILWKNCTTGKHILNGKISCLKLDGEKRVEYLRIDLTDIMVKSIKWNGVGDESCHERGRGIRFCRISQEYMLQSDVGDPQGAVPFGFNIQTSRV